LGGKKPQDRTKVALLRRKSAPRGLNFPENGCNFQNYQGKQVETGSMPTACTANQSGLCPAVSAYPNSPDIPAG